ncbi:MAG TPA: ABC transporter substrate-binding protein [Chloroflexota bacterium]|nr:ABC transporter substrate-binding protein [Chloroflexota bacterium]
MTEQFSRRSALKLLASGAGMVVLAACGSAAAPTSSTPVAAPSSAPPKPSAAAAPASASAAPIASASSAPVASVSSAAKPSAAPSGQPKTGGTIRFGATADIPNLDGHQRSATLTDTTWTAFDRLIQYDDKGKPQPMLAESWDLAPDDKSVTFHLRKGVTFHTGREFTSDDVKWNLLRGKDPKVGSGSYVTWANWVTSIDTPDKYTVALKFDNSRPSIFDWFEYYNMLDSVVMQGPDAQTKLSGTGPFVFQEWKQGTSISFTKNKNYWDTGKPYIDGHITSIVQANAGIAQLEAGAIDMIKTESVDDIVRLKKDPKYQAISHPFSGSFYEFGINATKPPYDNKLVRQALNFAINRDRFASTLMQGLAKPLTLFWSSTSPAYDDAKNKAVPFDLAKAKSLLQQAGVTNLEADLLYIPGSYPILTPFAEIYQADLAQIGVKLNIKAMETAPWLVQVNGLQYNGLYVSGDGLGNYQPATPLGASPAWSPVKNNSGFKTDQWSQLVDAAGIETDPAKQKTLYGQINDYMIDQAWSIVFAERLVLWLARVGIKNVNPTGRSSFIWSQAWIDS